MLQAQRHALEVKNRLRNPLKTVVDDGIDLKRPKVRIVIPISEVEAPIVPATIANAEVWHQLAESKRMISELEATIVRLKACRDLLEEDIPSRPSVSLIQTIVAAHYNVTRLDILRQSRIASVVLPRHVAMYLARDLTLKSFPEIGKLFNDRDHTTVLNAVQKIKGLMIGNEMLAAEVGMLRNKITAAVEVKSVSEATA